MVDEPGKTQGRYLSYLLRLWRENGGDRPCWRAALEKPQTEQRQTFSTLADLFAYLEQEARLASPAPSLSNLAGLSQTESSK